MVSNINGINIVFLCKGNGGNGFEYFKRIGANVAFPSLPSGTRYETGDYQYINSWGVGSSDVNLGTAVAQDVEDHLKSVFGTSIEGKWIIQIGKNIGGTLSGGR